MVLSTHPQSKAKVKERVQLYLYSPLWDFMACSRMSFTFTFYNPFILYAVNTVCSSYMLGIYRNSTYRYPITCVIMFPRVVT